MSLPIALLEESLERIRPCVDEFASSFYARLFKTYPELQQLFARTDMAEQKKMLLGTLMLVVKNLHKPQLIASSLKRLGGRHVNYGASSEYFPLLGDALLSTFKQYLGSDWTIELEQAWIEAYDAISELMLEGVSEKQSLKSFRSVYPRKGR